MSMRPLPRAAVWMPSRATTPSRSWISSSAGFYQDANGGPTSVEINPNFYSFVPDLEWDSRVTIGALDQTGNQFGSNNLGSVGIDWSTFENGGTLRR